MVGQEICQVTIRNAKIEQEKEKRRGENKKLKKY